MKIALLNLTVDNNYGGNLQRYALYSVLTSLGHNVVFLNVRTKFHLPWYKKPYSYIKRWVMRTFMKTDIPIDYERYKTIQLEKLCKGQGNFVESYLNHSNPMYSIREVEEYVVSNFDAVVVGSDQIWRKRMTRQLGIDNYFLKFLEGTSIRRVIYSASFGVDYNQFSSFEIKKLGYLYEKLDSVSVRENSAIKLIKQYKWKGPEPVLTLDPTFLLPVSNYLSMINDQDTRNYTGGKIFCYVLDMKPDVMDVIRNKELEYGISSYIHELNDNSNTSIKQWLSNIYHSTLVVTDSYHGLLFSLIFNKQFVLIKNNDRGASRFDSILEILNLDLDTMHDIDYSKVNSILNLYIANSLHYLRNSLIC